MSLHILYHGTDVESAKNICFDKNINVRIGAKHTDFGTGFYTTDNFEYAAKWACRKAKVRKSYPAVVTVFFDEEDAEELIEHFSDDLRWARFVINNSNGLSYISKIDFKEHNLDSKYEITEGRIADKEVVGISEELKTKGIMLKSQYDILNMEYPRQVVFHTCRATDYIKKVFFRKI